MEFYTHNGQLYYGVADDDCNLCDIPHDECMGLTQNCVMRHQGITWKTTDGKTFIKKENLTFVKGNKTTLNSDENIKTVFNDVEHIGIDSVCQCGESFAVSLLKIGSHDGKIRCYGCNKHVAYIIEVPMKKYTMISLTQTNMGAFITKERIKTNNIEKSIKEYPDISCVYEGWPRQQGEEDEPKVDKIYRYYK